MSKAALRSRTVTIQIEPKSEEVRRSLILRHERELSRYCILGDKLIGRCPKDCCGRDDGIVGQEQVSR